MPKSHVTAYAIIAIVATTLVRLGFYAANNLEVSWKSHSSLQNLSNVATNFEPIKEHIPNDSEPTDGLQTEDTLPDDFTTTTISSSTNVKNVDQIEHKQNEPFDAVNIDSVSPNALSFGTNAIVSITGKGFRPGTRVLLNKAYMIPEGQANNGLIKFQYLGGTFGEGMYDITVINTDGTKFTLPRSLRIFYEENKDNEKAPVKDIEAKTLEEKEIDPQVIVGIYCIWNERISLPSTGELLLNQQTVGKGSGVIIHPKGYVLTNRHVVEGNSGLQDFEIEGEIYTLRVNSTLDHCEVGNLPKGYTLPTLQQIKDVNPIIRLPALAYTAALHYIPNASRFSRKEQFSADFAILKINGLSKDGPLFGYSLPSSFPYAELLAIRPYLKAGDPLVTYGFPGDITEARKESFNVLNMTGSIGKVTGVEFGDKYFSDTPLTIRAKMEIYQGRSGSPVFWNGYVVGLVQARAIEDRTDSYIVAIDAILKEITGKVY
jgi:hypothetical protein